MRHRRLGLQAGPGIFQQRLTTRFRRVRRIEAGSAYDILVESQLCRRSRDSASLTVLRLGLSPVARRRSDRACGRDSPRAADVALLFVGLNGEWDGEGMDRPNIDLPHRQNELDRARRRSQPEHDRRAAERQPGRHALARQVAAVLQAWYPGQEAGNSIADVLLGKAEPGGRLPQTFPQRLEDDPTYVNYPGERGHVRYGEGVYVGYRYYEKKKSRRFSRSASGFRTRSFAAGR